MAIAKTIEERIIVLMLATLAKAGWRPLTTFDGEEHHATITDAQVLEYCFCADESHIHFKHADWPSTRWVYVINGEGYTTITDHSYDALNDETPPRGDTFRAIMDEVDNLIEVMEEEDNKDDGCNVCNGSGEGQTDGSRCPYCKGKGLIAAMR